MCPNSSQKQVSFPLPPNCNFEQIPHEWSPVYALYSPRMCLCSRVVRFHVYAPHDNGYDKGDDVGACGIETVHGCSLIHLVYMVSPQMFIFQQGFVELQVFRERQCMEIQKEAHQCLKQNHAAVLNIHFVSGLCWKKQYQQRKHLTLKAEQKSRFCPCKTNEISN